MRLHCILATVRELSGRLEICRWGVHSGSRLTLSDGDVIAQPGRLIAKSLITCLVDEMDTTNSVESEQRF